VFTQRNRFTLQFSRDAAKGCPLGSLHRPVNVFLADTGNGRHRRAPSRAFNRQHLGGRAVHQMPSISIRARAAAGRVCSVSDIGGLLDGP